MRWFFLLLSLLYFLKTLAGVFKLNFSNKTKSRYRTHTYLGAQMSYVFVRDILHNIQAKWSQIGHKYEYKYNSDNLN